MWRITGGKASAYRLGAAWPPRLAEVLLVLAAAWVVAGWITGEPVHVQRSSTAAADVDQVLAAVDVQALIAAHPFGKKAEKKTAPPPKTVKTVVSRRPIKLLGTIEAGAKSAAFVQVGAGPLQLFRIGDVIQPGVILREVRHRRIIIAAGGKLEVVLMPEESPLPASAGRSNVAEGGNHRPATSRHRLPRAALTRELADLPRLMSQARVFPYLKNGKNEGFLITEIVPGSLYARIGLRNNDVIQSVNGVRITSPDQALALYQQLKEVPAIDLGLLRHGKKTTIHYDIR